MKIAWQTPVTGILLIAQFGLAALVGAAAIPDSGIHLTPFVLLVALPTTAFGIGWCLNQLKAVGAPAIVKENVPVFVGFPAQAPSASPLLAQSEPVTGPGSAASGPSTAPLEAPPPAP